MGAIRLPALVPFRLPLTRPGFDASYGFHSYAMRWTKDAMAFYVDGKLIPNGVRKNTINEPMYMLARWP